MGGGWVEGCEFACATVSYLGKEVGNRKVRPLGSKIQVI